MRYAIIEDGKVVNMAASDAPLEDNWVFAEDSVDIGYLYNGSEFIPPPAPAPDPVALAAQARAKRDSLLSASDWTQLPDAPVDHAAWATYRQALRDITKQPDFPFNINWPTPPS